MFFVRLNVCLCGRGYGETGKRVALRMLWRNPWGFKSPYPHQKIIVFLLARLFINLLELIT